MRIGITLGDADTTIGTARTAEEAGFDLVGCGEHLFFHGPTPSAFAQLGAAAGATTRIGLVSAVTLLPLWPAALAAKLAVALDQVSGGRFELGVGAGGEFPAEFHAAGVDPADRFRRLDEGLGVIRRLFRGEAVTHDGEFARLDDLRLDPPPVRPGGPPIWVGGRKGGAQRRAGRHGDVWLPYMVDPEQVRAGLENVRAAAVEHGRAPGDVGGALLVWTAVDPDAARARGAGIEAVSATYAQDFTPLADRYLLLGDPDTVLARLAEFAAAGVSTVLLSPAAPDADGRRRIVESLAADVLPRARAL